MATTLTSITKIIWLISDYWLSFLDLEEDAINPKNVQEAVNLIIEVMRPYLSDATLAEFFPATTPSTPTISSAKETVL
uniref:Uncharacterized protein n=1 Tax=Desmonostoc muscorum LEGE 12446 TaxID=1828758 RepID=A0A8J7D0J5_DESMC